MKNWWMLLKSSWHRSISLLWIIIIALQWLSFTDPIWLRETSTVVLISLTATAIIDILLPLSVVYRMIVEAAAVLYTVYRTLHYYGLYDTSYPSEALGGRLTDFLSQTAPYIWFALGAWGLMLSASFLITTRSRIILFIGMNIAAFAALDSFTPSVLWQEVAWTVFAGLGWLVSQHLKSFQRRYPRSWKSLLDYPLKIAVNVAVIFALVILAGVNAPAVKPTLTDPYTVWREWNGDASQGQSTGKSGEGTGGTGASGTSSGYSLNDSTLGGGFAFDYSPVMSVTSNSRIYMRGETRSVYSGKGWSDDVVGRRGGRQAAAGERLENDYAPSIEVQELQYTVRMLGNNRYPVLFGAYSISRIDSIDGKEEAGGLSWRSRDGELVIDEAGSAAYPKTYELTSELPIVPVQELRAKTFSELYDGKDIPDPFLQLPDNFPGSVSELAREVTAGAQTPYEKTVLLQQYLQQTFPYTNEPDLSLKRSGDFVESFLFEIKEGYCDYYSTALVTMARSLNIPARWVKGYAPGEPSGLSDNLNLRSPGQAANNNYTITNADAHSWAEVYFGDYGWIPVEATPGFNAPLLTQSESEPRPEPSVAPETEPRTEEQTADPVAEESGGSAGLWVAAAAVIIACWAAFLLWHYRMKLRFLLPRIRGGRPLTPAEKVVAETERWIAFMRRKGFAKAAHETLRESVFRWSGERPEAAASLSGLLGWFEKAKYSPEVIEDKDWLAVYTEALRLRKGLKRAK